MLSSSVLWRGLGKGRLRVHRNISDILVPMITLLHPQNHQKGTNFSLACFWGPESGRMQSFPWGSGGTRILQQKQIRKKISQEIWEVVKKAASHGKLWPYFSLKRKMPKKEKYFVPNPQFYSIQNFWTIKKKETFIGNCKWKNLPGMNFLIVFI